MKIKMIIGNGQLAEVFRGSDHSETVIFASGVANSNCKELSEFEREKNLLLKTLKSNTDKKFVYFSSCALSAQEYEKNEYYEHKINMENIVKEYSGNYYIFRIPQLFGKLKEHKTLINFIYGSIKNHTTFKVYNEAYRYVIEINDTKILVDEYLKYSKSCVVIDIANPYNYLVLDIVKIFEKLLDIKANYEIINKKDGYNLEFEALLSFTKEHNTDIEFGKNYFEKKIINYINK